MAIFVLGCLLMLNLGYKSISVNEVSYNIILPSSVFNSKVNSYIIVILYGLISVYYIYVTTGLSIFSPTTWSFDFGAVYSRYQQQVSGQLSYSNLQLLVFTFKALLFPMALIVYCGNFSTNRLLVVLFCIPMVGSSFARGTDKETIDVMIFLLTAALYHNLSRKWFVYGFGILVVAGILFMERKIGRFNDTLPACLPILDICMNYNSAIAEISPKLEFLSYILTSYITQGYEGLSFAFAVPFEFNYGLGHVPPLARAICKLTDALCNIPTYPTAIETAGWQTKYFWITAYTYLANDLSFYFVPLYMFLIGRIMGGAERYWIQKKSPIALATLLMLAIFIIYSPANMQPSISLDSTFSWILLVYVPLLTMRWRLANNDLR